MNSIELTALPLSRAAFAPFGDVIEVRGRTPKVINEGTAERYHDLADLDLLQDKGRPLLNIFRAQPVQLPLRIRMVERHPLSSQCFVPMDGARFLVVVAAPSLVSPLPAELQVFVTNGRQGVNYHRNVWHHPLLALDRVADFLVVDREGLEDNCEECWFGENQEVGVTEICLP